MDIVTKTKGISVGFTTYICCQSGLELTFRLEYQTEPGKKPASVGRAGGSPGSSFTCHLRDAWCLAIAEPERGTCRLTTPDERRHWGDWLLGRIELDRVLERAIERACLAAVQELLPPARVTRVAARWQRAA